LNLTVVDWSVDPANYSLPPALEKAPSEAIQSLMTGKFRNSFLENFENDLNSKISEYFGTGSRVIQLNSTAFTPPVFVNYTVSEDPVFTEHYLSLGLEVGIRLNDTKCPIKDILPAVNQTHDVLISVSHTILDCIFNDIATTNLGLYAREKKIVDPRFQADIKATPRATWTPNNFTTTLETNFDLPVSGLLKTVLPINNTVYDLAQFSVDGFIIIKIDLNVDDGTVDFGLKDNSLKISQLSCNVVPNSSLSNTHYAEQLNKENWDDLIKKVLALLPRKSMKNKFTLYQGLLVLFLSYG